jgi:hypothetical protein
MKTTPKIASRQLPEPVRKPVTELTLALRALLGPQLEQVILFGSYARGEAQPPILTWMCCWCCAMASISGPPTAWSRPSLPNSR